MIKLYKDKEINWIIEILEIVYLKENNISYEDIECINRIHPKTLKIDGIIWTVKNIKALGLLNFTNINVDFDNEWMANFYIWFINTPIHLFYFKSDQMLTFEWELIKLIITKSKIAELKWFKVYNDDFLFIPLDTIGRISCSGFKSKLSSKEINKQFADLDIQHQFNTNGFVLPIRYLNRIFIELNDFELDYLNQIKDINKLFKEKDIDLTIWSLDRLLEINQLWPDDFLRINIKYIDYCSTEMSKYSISEMMDSSNWINLKFWEISKSYMLSPDEFQFWWKVLHSKRTRFNITSIYLKFNLLSECLTVLFLCSDCPELKSVELEYLITDTENEHKTIEQAKSEFRRKFEYIQKLVIRKFLK